MHHQAKGAAEETEKNFEYEEEREAAVMKPLAGSGGLHAVPAMVATEARTFPCECGRVFNTGSGRGSHRANTCPLPRPTGGLKARSTLSYASDVLSTKTKIKTKATNQALPWCYRVPKSKPEAFTTLSGRTVRVTVKIGAGNTRTRCQ